MPDETPAAQQRTLQGDWRPIPDPTVLTTEALTRGLQAERDYVDGKNAVLLERLSGIDRATELLDATVHRVPTDIQKEISHLSSVMDERFKSIELQFAERDTRSERESRDNKVAVDAAFAAQKEAAAQAEVSNAKAIDKSERATAETINKLNELFQNSAQGLTDKIDDLKIRMTSLESLALGNRQALGDRHANTTSVTAVLGAVAAFLTIVVVIAIATHGFTK